MDSKDKKQLETMNTKIDKMGKKVYIVQGSIKENKERIESIEEKIDMILDDLIMRDIEKLESLNL